ncbi:hypothetical protein ACH5RR_022843 [Cinchona calisaya]|uniref:F-box domain-containing protein n=1 Tax=Cinchona calisaya TaxID=153742 RepID=A0ABD2Z8Y4_9GENT
MTQGTFPDLPSEEIVIILLSLPAESLIRFMCLSKAWYALISSGKFIQKHLQVMASRDNQYISCGPPKDQYYGYGENDNEIIEIESDEDNNGVIKIESDNDNNVVIEIEVDDITDNNNEVNEIEVDDVTEDNTGAIEADDDISDAEVKMIFCRQINKDESMILSFDLEKEILQQIKLPNYDHASIEHVENVVYKDTLGFVVIHPIERTEFYSLWVMKEYDVADSWSKLFNVEIVDSLILVEAKENFLEQGRSSIRFYEEDDEALPAKQMSIVLPETEDASMGNELTVKGNYGENEFFDYVSNELIVYEVDVDDIGGDKNGRK